MQLIMLGGGAFCNGQKIHASQTDRVRDHVLIKIKILDFSHITSGATFKLGFNTC
jgi:hypothetical protein